MSKQGEAEKFKDQAAALAQSSDPEAQKVTAELLELLLAGYRDAVETNVGDVYELKHPVTVDGKEHASLTVAKEINTRIWTNAQISAAHPEEVEKFALAEMYQVHVNVIWALWPSDTRELVRRLNHFFF